MPTQTKQSIYSELVNLVARSDPQRLLSFRLSPKSARRVETLIQREKDQRLKPIEKEELDTYMHLSRIVMLAQAQAYKATYRARIRKNS